MQGHKAGDIKMKIFRNFKDDLAEYQLERWLLDFPNNTVLGVIAMYGGLELMVLYK